MDLGQVEDTPAATTFVLNFRWNMAILTAELKEKKNFPALVQLLVRLVRCSLALPTGSLQDLLISYETPTDGPAGRTNGSTAGSTKGEQAS